MELKPTMDDLNSYSEAHTHTHTRTTHVHKFSPICKKLPSHILTDNKDSIWKEDN